MSAKKSQNPASIITSNITSPPSSKTRSKETKSLNNEVDDKIQKIQQSSKQQGDDDEEDLSDLENGGWEDDFTDNEEEDAESRKEWETLEFLCQISKTRSKNSPYKDENGDVKNRKNDSSIIDSNSENDDDDDSSDSAVERNRTEKSVKDSENSKNNENNDNENSENNDNENSENNDNENSENYDNENSENNDNENSENNDNENSENNDNKNNEIKHDEIISSSIPNNIEQPSSPHHSNIENRKRRASENGDGTLFQKTKKPKDDVLEIQ